MTEPQFPLRAPLGDMTSQRILDVGCGTGWLLRQNPDIRPQGVLFSPVRGPDPVPPSGAA